jgi:hypothetical protein
MNGVQVTIRMYPTRDEFRLMRHVKEGQTVENFKVSIVDARLKVCMVKLTDGALIGIQDGLQISPAIYPIVKSDIKTFAIPQGQHSLTVDNVYQGRVPSWVCVGLVNSDSANGSYVKNPLNFQNYKLNFAAFYVNNKSLPGRPFQPKYEFRQETGFTGFGGNYQEAYTSLFTGTGKYLSNEGNDISRFDYANGYCFYIFDIGGRAGQDDMRGIIKNGHTRLDLKFAEALPEAVVCVVYAKFPSQVEVDITRNVILQ